MNRSRGKSQTGEAKERNSGIKENLGWKILKDQETNRAIEAFLEVIIPGRKERSKRERFTTMRLLRYSRWCFTNWPNQVMTNII